MIRATTGGVLKSYRANLMGSFVSMNKARDTVLSQRTFNSYAEDPAAAAKAFRLRKSRMTVDSQHSICSDALKKYETGFSCLQSIDEVLDTKNGEPSSAMKTLKGTTLTMLNDPSGDAREQLTKVLDQMSEMLIQNMNQKYGDNFIFAGADGHNVPFEIKNGELFYRGVSVDAAVPNVITNGKDADGNPIPMKVNTTVQPPLADTNGGSYVKMDASAFISQEEFDNIIKNDPTATQPKILYQNATDPQFFDGEGNVVDPATYTGKLYYLNMDKAETMTIKEYDDQVLEAEKLEYLKGETNYVDIGLGFQENKNGELIPSSGFNAALNGINFFGCGLDEDGDPKNIYSLVQKLKGIGAKIHDGEQWTDADYDEFNRLVGKLELASSDFKTEFTNMAASTTKLQNNEKLLEENFYNLQEQYAAIEDVDMVDSITSFIWAQYCYNAALKVGNSVLSESLMDYLN